MEMWLFATSRSSLCQEASEAHQTMVINVNGNPTKSIPFLHLVSQEEYGFSSLPRDRLLEFGKTAL